MSRIYAQDVEGNHGFTTNAVPEGFDVELTYVPDLGSNSPQEEDMAEPTGSAIDSMTTAMKRAKARLLLVAPKGAQPSMEWSHRLTTYSDGTESLDTGWTAAVYLNSKSLAFGRADTLDAAVLKCVAALVDRKPATPVTTTAGLERALGDVLDDDYPDAEDRYHAEHGSAA